ncbi:undecaprenyl-diphosphatase [Clostridium acidisoli DSM 12555]|uniref:Undecaprenyl-diphosphatase n=1 Tax=Clostridium acidisoli DSM 12555 TaxID=1121291 RepID=A0A1W1XD91_9CLOT|nr:phosphatase PAP2 family protein [Clostridium acidisoli]SMC21859.1 undecaprenyl-diphosphatase [Clostridium acidisoli DSM 12555]
MYSNILKQINIFDNYVLFIINRKMKNKYLDKVMPVITSLGNLGVVWLAIAVILLFVEKNKSIGEVVILTMIFSTIVGEGIIKHLVKRVRPCNQKNNSTLLIVKPISYSFPSGHTLSSFAAAEVLSIYFINYKIIFITIALLIALSRIYLYVHYPTDVIAGMLIGILCSKLIFIILQEIYINNVGTFLKNIL